MHSIRLGQLNRNNSETKIKKKTCVYMLQVLKIGNVARKIMNFKVSKFSMFGHAVDALPLRKRAHAVHYNFSQL